MRVLVADSDPRVRTAMNLLLKFEPELAIIGESADAASLLADMQALAPDLVLLDWELPGNSITLLVEKLKKVQEIKIIVLSRRPEAEQAALTVGADAFVSKTDPADNLLETLYGLVKPPAAKPPF